MESSLKRLVLVLQIGTILFGSMVTLKYIRSVVCKYRYNYQTRKKKIFVCESQKDWLSCKDNLFKECQKSRFLGLDCEWVTVNRSQHKVALLQLATESGTCVLIRLCHLKKPLPGELLDLLHDQSILKVGVACVDDAKKLKADHGITVYGCLDLRYVFRAFSTAYDPSLKAFGLKSLAKYELNTEMKKQWKIQCSNWEEKHLTSKQVDYAVQDAVIAVDIFREIMNKKLLQNNVLLLKSLFLGRMNMPLANHWSTVMKLNEPFVDCNYKQKSHNSNAGISKKSKNINNIGPLGTRWETRAFSTRTKPLYENCQLLAPDGEVLCTCSIKKANWYLSKNKGVLINDNPMIVKLNFEPNGRPTLDGSYYTYDKENLCVVCGSTKSLLKKHVVPHEYRKYFPDLLKSRTSHDVVLLCVNCNVRSNSFDSVLRMEFARKCHAPIGTEEDVKVFENPELKKVKSAARALLNSRDKLPEPRLKELDTILSDFYNTSQPISHELLLKSSELDISILNSNYVSHGEKVVAFISRSENEGLLDFEATWRQHFVKEMKPQYLPTMWSTNHGHERISLIVADMADEATKKELRKILGLKM